MIKFLPSYVGSKASWVDRLEFFRGRAFVEPFAGSAVLSANLAGSAHVNDLDPYVYLILSRFDELIVPDSFSKDDYFAVRKYEDWWRWAYCLMKMSFSGVFRWSKNGFNVPIKPNLEVVKLRPHYLKALERWTDLQPLVTNMNYLDVNVLPDEVLIIDPPYEGSQAAYNKTFNYNEYWEWVDSLPNDKVVFDRAVNIDARGYPVAATRTMTVNGKYSGDTEAIALMLDGEWQSALAEMTLF